MTEDALDETSRRELMKKLGLTPAIIAQYLPKIAWRRQTKAELRGEFDEKYPEDPMTMFLMSGNAYFDKEILAQRSRELTFFRPYQTMGNGQAAIFHQRVPGRRYIIGADPASGRQVFSDDTDYSAAVVYDFDTMEEMAAYRARVIPSEFAADLDDLGRYFNSCPIAVERTGDGGTVILTLQGDCKYPLVAKFREWHRKTKKFIEVEGFPTTPRTRPIALGFLQHHVQEHPELIWDIRFVKEALSFVRNEKGIPAGANGGHDDTVSARWIAWGMRMHLLGYFEPSLKSKGYSSASLVSAV